MDDDEIIRQFVIFCNGNGSDGTEIANAIEFTYKFRKSPDCLSWVFRTYNNLADKRLRMEQLFIIKNYCKAQDIPFPDDFYTPIHDFLFTQQNHVIFQNERDFMNVLADTQVSFMWKVFPEKWENFWADYFNSFSENFIISFLEAFSQYPVDLEGKENYLFTKIKDAMRSNQSDNEITQYVIRLMGNGVGVSFNIFKFLCSWVDLNYLLNDNSYAILKKCLDNKDYLKYTLEILSSLVSRGMNDNLKVNIIKSFDLENKIQNIVQNCINDREIAISAGSLVNSIGEFLIKEKVLGNFVDLALIFLSHDDTYVSCSVINYLKLVCKVDRDTVYENPENPRISTTILLKGIERIIGHIEYFEEECPYFDSLTQLCHVAINASPKVNFNALLSLWNNGENLGSNPKLAVSILHVVAIALRDKENRDFIPTFTTEFSKILAAQPPIDPIIMYGIIEFVDFFIAARDSFGPEQASFVFNFVCNFAFMEESDENRRFIKDIRSRLFNFARWFFLILQFDPNIIPLMIQTSDVGLAAATTYLIQRIDKNLQSDVIIQCLDHLLNTFKSLEDDNAKVSYLDVILSFLRNLRYEKDSPQLVKIRSILEIISPLCSMNDSLFDKFIHATVSSLRENSIDIIKSCLPHITIGYKSLSAYCNAVQNILKLSGIQKDAWITTVIGYLFNIVFEKFGSNIHASRNDSINDEEYKETLQITCSFIELFLMAVRMAPDFILPLYDKMKEFVIQLLKDHFDIAVLDEKVCDLLSEIVSRDIDSVLNDLGVLLMNFLYTYKFNPDQDEWFRVCKRVLAFHRHIKEINPERAKQLVDNSFRTFITNNEQFGHFIKEYYEILSMTRIQSQFPKLKLFYIELAKYVSQNL